MDGENNSSSTTTTTDQTAQQNDTAPSSVSPSPSPSPSPVATRQSGIFPPRVPSRRVKLYHLNDDGKWDDKGTGHASVLFLQSPQPPKKQKHGAKGKRSSASISIAAETHKKKRKMSAMAVDDDDDDNSHDAENNNSGDNDDNDDNDKDTIEDGDDAKKAKMDDIDDDDDGHQALDAHEPDTHGKVAENDEEEDVDGNYYLVMRSEDLPEVSPSSAQTHSDFLLSSRISSDDIYQLQGDTLIVWNDLDSGGIEMALSFAQPQGCADVWKEIELAQKQQLLLQNRQNSGAAILKQNGGHTHSYRGDDDEFHDVEFHDSIYSKTSNMNHSANNGDSSAGSSSSSFSASTPSCSLPDPEIANLPHIEEVLFEASTSFRKERIANLLFTGNYLHNLLDLFTMCEDIKDIPNLRRLFRISRLIVGLNDSNLLELITSDDYFTSFIGTLEYDPELPLNTSSSHRTLFQSSSKFKQIFSFSDPSLLPKIHCNYRLLFLRDVVLARFLEDSTLNTLNSLIYFNNVEIVGGIMADDKFLDNMFQLIDTQNSPLETLCNAFSFLHELNSLAKNLQPSRKTSFFKTLISKGLFSILEKYCTHEELKIRQSVSELIGSLINHDPNQLRTWIINENQQKSNYPFFRNLVTQLARDPDTGMKAQFTEIIRTLLDPETLTDTGPLVSISFDKDEIFNVFYTNLLDPLVSVLTDDPGVKDALFCEDRPQTQYYICGLLSFFVQHHGYRIKTFVLRKNLCGKVLRLLGSSDKHLALAAIRFFRVCASLKDDFYNRYFIRNKLFDPIIEIFKENGPRYNLLNSAIIELFAFIRNENIKQLVEHVVEKYREFFETVTYVDVFKGLITRYEQNKDHEESLLDRSSSSSLSDRHPCPTHKRHRPIDEDDDEDYFNRDDDDDDNDNDDAGSAHSDEIMSPGMKGSPLSPLSPPAASSPSTSTSLTPLVSSSLLFSSPKKKPRLVDFGDDECMPNERDPSADCSF